jgi:hypothetical protein
MSDEFYRGQTPGALPPPYSHPDHADFERGRLVAQQNAERWQRGRDGVTASTAAWFSRGFFPAVKRWLQELIAVPLVLGLIAGLIAYFLNGDYMKAAAIAAGSTFVVLLVFGLFVFALYGLVRHGGQILLLAIVGGLAIVGLHAIGVVPKFW